MESFKTVCVTEDFVAVNKIHNIPTVPLKKSDSSQITLLSEVSKVFPAVLEVAGKNSWEGSSVHRLDTATGGLVLFALNQEFYDYMVDLQQKGGFVKKYTADVENDAFLLPDKIETYFRAFGVGRKIVKPETDIKKSDSKILYKTNIKTISKNRVECTIERGFRHQIRSHLAYLGCPIVGDVLYNPAFSETDTIKTNTIKTNTKKSGDYLHLECIEFSFIYKGNKNIIKLY